MSRKLAREYLWRKKTLKTKGPHFGLKKSDQYSFRPKCDPSVFDVSTNILTILANFLDIKIQLLSNVTVATLCTTPKKKG
jgi:hypothetical protein